MVQHHHLTATQPLAAAAGTELHPAPLPRPQPPRCRSRSQRCSQPNPNLRQNRSSHRKSRCLVSKTGSHRQFQKLFKGHWLGAALPLTATSKGGGGSGKREGEEAPRRGSEFSAVRWKGWKEGALHPNGQNHGYRRGQHLHPTLHRPFQCEMHAKSKAQPAVPVALHPAHALNDYFLKTFIGNI